MNRRFYISCAAVAAGLSLIGTIAAQAQVPINEPDASAGGNCPMDGKKDRPGREFRGDRGGKCGPGNQDKDECHRHDMRRGGQECRMDKCDKTDGCPMMNRSRGHHMQAGMEGRGVALEMLKQKYPAEVAEIEKLREQLSPLQAQLDNKVSALMERHAPT